MSSDKKKLYRDTPMMPGGNSKYKEVGPKLETPDRSVIINDAFGLLWVEIGRLKARQQAGFPLTPQEMKLMVMLSDSAAKLSKEERENDKGFKPEDMTDEEYLAQLQDAVLALQEKINAKKANTKPKEGKE